MRMPQNAGCHCILKLKGCAPPEDARCCHLQMQALCSSLVAMQSAGGGPLHPSCPAGLRNQLSEHEHPTPKSQGSAVRGHQTQRP